MRISIRGIKYNQKILSLPTSDLNQKNEKGIPVLVGKRMLKSLRLKVNDTFTIKWRDSKGVFDAREFIIVKVMDTINPRVDNNTIWIGIKNLEKMLVTNKMASLIVIKNYNLISKNLVEKNNKWITKSKDELTNWVKVLIEKDENWVNLIYSLLLFLSGIGLFNTQILSVYKRKKEIGTFMALGMRNYQITIMFTLEGIIITLFGFIGSIIIGFPFFYWTVTSGLPMGHAEGVGIPIPEKLIPHYTSWVVITTFLIIFIVTGSCRLMGLYINYRFFLYIRVFNICVIIPG
jgi:ABC-type lipoprotein release transport system permease subunit